ncbi:coagulation factor XIII B chain-like [Chamaea fasciata]|uniref:coagulation factor XIII B chain-like n=1 Tax=Chamaea fasciata TaxID=190680 RepID=UPI00336A1EDB
MSLWNNFNLQIAVPLTTSRVPSLKGILLLDYLPWLKSGKIDNSPILQPSPCCLKHTGIPSPGRTQCDHGRLKYPKCIIQAAIEKCGSPPSVANGALTLPALPQYASGSSVQYICSDYHFLQGPERIYCSQGQWTLPPVCIEPCTLSKTEMEKNNVLLQAFYADQVYFYHGDYVGFYCKQNHTGAESGTTLFQVQCKRGQLAYPRCVERGKQEWT